ncbi:tRNA (cytosine(38)-C(5))-methyltransferase [Amphibalanus amphitrite]|uniref:tRNA (Cytosine(38)-C(5))-methyltransferase n=1 Tax=Amphibalanus amphitrite TaxID=1232801 RepID=A0A6A4UUD6_AMPAM|nr:tRNA (cytosine(38)-C(5))-methyltransferase [Amphibalanus amphitrite]
MADGRARLPFHRLKQSTPNDLWNDVSVPAPNSTCCTCPPDCGVPLEVVAAVDINTTANSVYRHNFPSTRHLQRNIQSFSAAELDKLRPDVITMSPPCQPFSR